jgi:hypothetical protein
MKGRDGRLCVLCMSCEMIVLHGDQVSHHNNGSLARSEAVTIKALATWSTWSSFPLSSHSLVVPSFFSSFLFTFRLVLSLVLSFSISRKTDARRLLEVSASSINGPRVLVSKRVSHPEKTRLQCHLLRLTSLLLCVWLVHSGAHISTIVLPLRSHTREQATNARLAGLNTLKWSVWTSRGAGLVLAFDGGLILIPMLRNIIRFVRPKLSWLFPADENVWFHRQVAYSMAFWAMVHTTAHYVNFINVERTRASLM